MAYSDWQHTTVMLSTVRGRECHSVRHGGKAANSKRTKLYHWRYNSADPRFPATREDDPIVSSRIFCFAAAREWVNACWRLSLGALGGMDVWQLEAWWSVFHCQDVWIPGIWWGAGRLPDTDRRRPCTTKHACARGTEKQHTCARREDTRTERSVREAPAHRDALRSEAIFVLRPHAPRQFFSGDRVQSLQIDWSIFITGPGAQTDVFFFPPPPLKTSPPLSCTACTRGFQSRVIRSVFNISFGSEQSKSAVCPNAANHQLI